MKSILYMLVAALLVLPVASCNTEEFLKPENPVENPWLDVAEFEQAVIGAYYALSGNGGFRHVYTHRRGVNIVASDIGTFLPDAAGNADFESAYNREEGVNLGFLNNSVYRSCYNAIGNANAGLDFLADNNDNPYPNDPNRGQISRQKGELLFVRAFSYWSLALTYCPPYEPGGANDFARLPKRLSLPGNLAEATQSELFSVGEMYDQIRADLEEAKTLLPERYDAGAGHDLSYSDGRATRFAAAALLSRVYMQMGMEAEALAELNYVIDNNGGDFDLSEDPIEAFNRSDASRGREVIWYYLQYDGNGIGSWKRPGRFESYNKCDRGCNDGGEGRDGGGRTIVISDHALKLMGWINDDLTEPAQATWDKRYTQLAYRYETPGSDTINGNPPEPRFTNFSRPYVWNNKYYRAPTGGKSNTPMLRLGEMLLTRALIRFNNGDAQGAADDLNVVRERAWDADAAGTPYTPLAAGDVTADLIHIERMKEMFFEGDRLWYLQAQQIDIPNGDRGAGSVPYNSAGLYYEIPDQELDLNTVYQN
ncbi:MAG: RagB/SusD family nutrient uptake outer membrane protein [Bacteroidetes bacterium]|nr:MAG: RagB/SusD family nutrient uptake outer membrane protein [Bacteroidota bacterium]